jgi:hypothetical protein
MRRLRGPCKVKIKGKNKEINKYIHGATLLLEKLTVTQLVKKFPTFYGTGRFITVFTRARHWSPF